MPVHPPQRGAFSIVELLVVIGVAMILLGILAPAIAGARAAAEQTKWVNAMRTGAIALTLYESEQRSFPLPYDLASTCGQRWAAALVSTGYIDRRAEVEPGLTEDPSQYPGVWMSYTLAATPRWFMPPGGPDVYAAPSSPVRADMIAFPADKGMLLRTSSDPVATNPEAFCCGLPEWPASVAMADGSARMATWTTFVAPSDLVIVNNVGIPVLTTWGGYLAKD